MRAAETGRHIVIEKPVGVTLDDSLAIRDAVARAGVKTVTSFVMGTRKLYDYVDDNPSVEFRPSNFANDCLLYTSPSPRDRS